MQFQYPHYSTYSSISSSSCNPSSKFSFYNLNFILGMALTSSLNAFQKDFKALYQMPKRLPQTFSNVIKEEKSKNLNPIDLAKKNLYLLETEKQISVEANIQILNLKKDQLVEQKTRCSIQSLEDDYLDMEIKNKFQKAITKQMEAQEYIELKNVKFDAQIPEQRMQTSEIEKKMEQLRKRQVHNWNYFNKKQSRQLKRLCK